jgi:hypothetical protein
VGQSQIVEPGIVQAADQPAVDGLSRHTQESTD